MSLACTIANSLPQGFPASSCTALAVHQLTRSALLARMQSEASFHDLLQSLDLLRSPSVQSPTLNSSNGAVGFPLAMQQAVLPGAGLAAGPGAHPAVGQLQVSGGRAVSLKGCNQTQGPLQAPVRWPALPTTPLRCHARFTRIVQRL
jgi:hypothetical protein